MINQTISHYKILEQIGAGGMGVVYKAEDTKLKRTVALKFLPPELLRDKEAKERFTQEAQAASALDHNNICSIFEIDETEDGQIFIAMGYYEGETLKDKIAQNPFSVEDAVDITTQIAQGLKKAHEKGIVHRDIKPANIMITEDKVAKILDFGLAKLSGQSRLTKMDSTLGTVAYMSPEQTGGEDVDSRTDIWSLAVVLFEMLTGQLPFKGEYGQALTYSILNEEPKPLSGLRSGIPLELERIINKALAKDPNERYQHVDEMLVDLKKLKSTSLDLHSNTTEINAFKPINIIRYIAILVLGIFVIYALYSQFFAKREKELVNERKMLVVLPFENLGLPEDEYFADGMTDEITSRLAEISGLGVIARTSAIKYKNTDKTIKQIGEELNVDYLLIGTVRWEKKSDTDSRVRITPELISVSDVTHLWTHRYDAVLSGIFQIQTNVAEQIALALHIKLLEPEQKALRTKPTDNMSAYDFYLRGNDYLFRGLTEKDRRLAILMYKNAISLDPKFALAYAQLSRANSSFFWYYWDRSDDRREMAKKAVDKSFKLVSDLPEAYLALGYYYYWCNLDYERALEQFNIARKSQPNNANILAGIGYVQRRQGKFEETLTNLKSALILDPLSPMTAFGIGETYELIRNFNEAEKYYNQAIKLNPEWPRPYGHIARLSIKLKSNTENARLILKEYLQLIGQTDDPRVQLYWILSLIFDKKYQEALDWLTKESQESFATQFYFVTNMQLYAQIYDLLDQPQLAHFYYDSARIVLEDSLNNWSNDSRFHSALGITYAGLGRKADAIREGELAVELLPISKEAYRGTYRVEDLARIYVMLGEYEVAIDKLEFLLSQPGMLSANWLRLDPTWHPLRDIPRFRKLLEQHK